jgi:integrase
MRRTRGADGTDAMEIRLKYLYRDRDRHGNVRYYVCVPGRKKQRIRAEPGSEAFMVAYSQALKSDAEELTKRRSIKAGSLDELVLAYLASAEFKLLAPNTQKPRRSILERACDNLGNGSRDGEKPVRLLEPKHIRARRDAMCDRPEAANGYVKTMRQLFRWAVDNGTADRNPALEVPYLRTHSDGYHTWTRDEVRQFKRHHPLGTKAHLAITLLLCTGVRRSDVVKLGPQMIQNGRLVFKERKGETQYTKEHKLPLLPPLREAIAATPTGLTTFLVTEFGKPFSGNGFGNRFKKWCVEAGLPHCSAHGLRKAGATFAAENGASDKQLMAMFGWKSPKQASKYTEAAEKTRLADGGFKHLEEGAGWEEEAG